MCVTTGLHRLGFRTFRAGTGPRAAVDGVQRHHLSCSTWPAVGVLGGFGGRNTTVGGKPCSSKQIPGTTCLGLEDIPPLTPETTPMYVNMPLQSFLGMLTRKCTAQRTARNWGVLDQVLRCPCHPTRGCRKRRFGMVRLTLEYGGRTSGAAIDLAKPPSN